MCLICYCNGGIWYFCLCASIWRRRVCFLGVGSDADFWPGKYLLYSLFCYGSIVIQFVLLWQYISYRLFCYVSIWYRLCFYIKVSDKAAFAVLLPVQQFGRRCDTSQCGSWRNDTVYPNSPNHYCLPHTTKLFLFTPHHQINNIYPKRLSG